MFRERESKGKTAVGARDANLWEICPRRKALGKKRKKHAAVGSTGGDRYAGSSSQVGSTMPSCHRRRSTFCWIRCGASNKAGVMDSPPKQHCPSRVEGLEQIMVFPDHPNDSADVARSCQGEHLPGSGYGPVSPYQKNAAHQEQQPGSGQGHLLQEKGISWISHQIFPHSEAQSQELLGPSRGCLLLPPQVGLHRDSEELKIFIGLVGSKQQISSSPG